MEYLCKYKVYRVEILQGWCTARTAHCNNGYDVTIATYSLPDLYFPEMKTALFVAPEFNRLSCAVWCPYSLTPTEWTIRANNPSWWRKTVIFTSEWRGPEAHCVAMSLWAYHGTLRWISVVDSENRVRYSNFCDFTPLCVHVVMS